MDNTQNNMNGAVPTFTPPTPTFEPPKFSGPSCHYHRDEPAVAKCARCGRAICDDCYDNYSVTGGDYAGQALCYDCCKQLVAENVQELTKNKKTIKFHFILSIVGMSIGFLMGFVIPFFSLIASGEFSGEGALALLITGLVFAGVGGVFFSFVKFYFQALWEGIKLSFKTLFEGGGIWGIVGVFIGIAIRIIIEAFKAVYYTIVNTIDYIKYLKETDGFIESDTAALHQMEDYMEYTLIRNQNRGVDLETLLNQKSELADNSYARMVQEKGENGAEAALRGCVASINENGEIIRSFNNRAA